MFLYQLYQYINRIYTFHFKIDIYLTMMHYSRNSNLPRKENFDHEVEFDSSSPRCGKWSAEEEDYANGIITEFETGTLTDCPDGSTLRSYLAKRLNCAPMRISKKFAGQCIGKLTFSKKNYQYDVSSHSSTVAEQGSLIDEEKFVVGSSSFDNFAELPLFQFGEPMFYVPLSQESTYPAQWANQPAAPLLKRPHFQDLSSNSDSDDYSVGLDLDEMSPVMKRPRTVSLNEGDIRLVEVTPDPMKSFFLSSNHSYLNTNRCTPPACATPDSESMGMYKGATHTPMPLAPYRDVCADQQRSSPISMIHSGASPRPPVLTTIYANSAWQCRQQPQEEQQYVAAEPVATKCPAQIEAEEWRDVLDFFCSQADEQFPLSPEPQQLSATCPHCAKMATATSSSNLVM